MQPAKPFAFGSHRRHAPVRPPGQPGVGDGGIRAIRTAGVCCTGWVRAACSAPRLSRCCWTTRSSTDPVKTVFLRVNAVRWRTVIGWCRSAAASRHMRWPVWRPPTPLLWCRWGREDWPGRRSCRVGDVPLARGHGPPRRYWDGRFDPPGRRGPGPHGGCGRQAAHRPRGHRRGVHQCWPTSTRAALFSGGLPKGDALPVARIAAIQAASGRPISYRCAIRSL